MIHPGTIPRPAARNRVSFAHLHGYNAFIISCEHGGNRVPPEYRTLFAGAGPVLRSHRGYDPGALWLARTLAAALDAPLFVATTSRLLIDLNRSIGHPKLYSAYTRVLPASARQVIVARYYQPYRDRIEAAIADAIAQDKRVLHLSSHTFTPVLDGEVRQTDIGLLYDPARIADLQFCRHWQAALDAETGLRTRMNYPYKGTADGFAERLRRRFPEDLYTAVEIEVNQKHFRQGKSHWRQLCAAIAGALSDTVALGAHAGHAARQ